MIDRIELKREDGSTVLELNQEVHSRAPLFEELEVWLDQHYGIRIVRDGEWTKVSFREAGTWTTPIAGRDLYRKLAAEPPARVLGGRAKAGRRAGKLNS